MNKLKHICFMLFMIFTCGICYSNNYTRTYDIKHPNLSYENPEPLVIEIHWTMGKTKSFTEKIVCHPFMHVFYNQNGDIEYKSSWIIYQDAFKYLDNKGIILITKKKLYEEERYYNSIEIYYEFLHGYIQEPKGSALYWSADGKYLVLVAFPSPFEKVKKPIKLYYYEHSKFIKEETISNFSEFRKLGLIEVK